MNPFEDVTTESDIPILENDDPKLALKCTSMRKMLARKIVKRNWKIWEIMTLLWLSNYKIPRLTSQDYGSGKIEIDKSELEANKNRIVDTLANYKIG